MSIIFINNTLYVYILSKHLNLINVLFNNFICPRSPASFIFFLTFSIVIDLRFQLSGPKADFHHQVAIHDGTKKEWLTPKQVIPFYT